MLREENVNMAFSSWKNWFATIKASNSVINTLKIWFPQAAPKESSLKWDTGHRNDKWKANTKPSDISKTRWLTQWEESAVSTRGRSTLAVVFNGPVVNCLLNIHVYTYRPGLLSAFITEASFCRRQQPVLRCRTGHRAETKWLWAVSLNGTPHQPLCQSSWDTEEEVEKLWELETREGCCGRLPSWHGDCTPESQLLWWPAQDQVS